LPVVVDSRAYNVPMLRLAEKCDISRKIKLLLSASRHLIQADVDYLVMRVACFDMADAIDDYRCIKIMGNHAMANSNPVAPSHADGRGDGNCVSQCR
jgi:hypothetical protein